MTTVTAPGFYAASSAQTWGTVPLTPIEAKSLIPAELQAGAKLYAKLFPPPPPGTFWQTWGPVIASVAIFAAGAGALSLLGTGAAAGSAGSAVASTATSTTAAATGGTVTQASVDSAWAAMQSSGGYIGSTLGVSGVAGATGAAGAGVSVLSQVGKLLGSSGVKSKLATVAKNLVMSQLPPGTQLTPSEQAMMDNMIQGRQSQFAAALETPNAGYAMGTTSATGKTSSLMVYGIVGVIALKLAGVL